MKKSILLSFLLLICQPSLSAIDIVCPDTHYLKYKLNLDITTNPVAEINLNITDFASISTPTPPQPTIDQTKNILHFQKAEFLEQILPSGKKNLVQISCQYSINSHPLKINLCTSHSFMPFNCKFKTHDGTACVSDNVNNCTLQCESSISIPATVSSAPAPATSSASFPSQIPSSAPMPTLHLLGKHFSQLDPNSEITLSYQTFTTLKKQAEQLSHKTTVSGPPTPPGVFQQQQQHLLMAQRRQASRLNAMRSAASEELPHKTSKIPSIINTYEPLFLDQHNSFGESRKRIYNMLPPAYKYNHELKIAITMLDHHSVTRPIPYYYRCEINILKPKRPTINIAWCEKTTVMSQEITFDINGKVIDSKVSGHLTEASNIVSQRLMQMISEKIASKNPDETLTLWVDSQKEFSRRPQPRHMNSSCNLSTLTLTATPASLLQEIDREQLESDIQKWLYLHKRKHIFPSHHDFSAKIELEIKNNTVMYRITITNTTTNSHVGTIERSATISNDTSNLIDIFYDLKFATQSSPQFKKELWMHITGGNAYHELLKYICDNIELSFKRHLIKEKQESLYMLKEINNLRQLRAFSPGTIQYPPFSETSNKDLINVTSYFLRRSLSSSKLSEQQIDKIADYAYSPRTATISIIDEQIKLKQDMLRTDFFSYVFGPTAPAAVPPIG